MQVGQVILIKDIEKIGGRAQESTIRPAIIRKVYTPNLIDVRLVSTIYVNGNVKAKTLNEAQSALINNFKGLFPDEEQYVIITPDEDGVINFSYVFGNMYTDIINTAQTPIVILKNKQTNQPIVISEDTKMKIEEKEIEAIIKDIIKTYNIELKKIK